MPDFFNCATFKNDFVDHLKRRLPQLSPSFTAEMIIGLNRPLCQCLGNPLYRRVFVAYYASCAGKHRFSDIPFQSDVSGQ